MAMPPTEGYLRPHEISRPTLSQDTDPEAEVVQLEIYRRMTAARKLGLVNDAILTSRQLAMAGLRARFPNAGPAELKRRYMTLLHGDELATSIWGPLEDAVRADQA